MNKRLFVGGIPFSTTKDELTALFSPFGKVVSAAIIADKFTGQSKGFGFVEMETEAEATEASAKLNETDFGGRKLTVVEAKPMEDRPRGGGGFRGSRDGAGFGKRREGGRGNFGRDGRGGGDRSRGGFSRGGGRGGR